MDVGGDVVNLAAQVVAATVGAYAGVSARLARVEERAIAAATMAAEARLKAEKLEADMSRHVEVFHTTERTNRA